MPESHESMSPSPDDRSIVNEVGKKRKKTRKDLAKKLIGRYWKRIQSDMEVYKRNGISHLSRRRTSPQTHHLELFMSLVIDIRCAQNPDDCVNEHHTISLPGEGDS